MAGNAFLWGHIIATCLISTTAGYVGAYWNRVSRSSAWLKRLNECEAMVADLESSFASLMESHKRLRSREGMRRLREERIEPAQESKAEARKRVFGVTSGPDFARRQMEYASRHGDRQV